MQFKVIALDLDGTIATNDHVEQATWEVLREAKEVGFVLLLVTGRRLADLAQIRPFEDICEAIVAEDGAAVYFPGTDSVILPFGQLAEEVVERLYALQIPLEKGMAIASTWTPHDQVISQVLATTGYPATIEYNKGAVMIMPPGATKGSGLANAIRELGYSAHNVIAFGDAENDRSLFEQAGLSVAVANATKSIKNLADIVLPEANGKGVRKFIGKLMTEGAPFPDKIRSTRQIKLGAQEKGGLILNPLKFTMGNIGIFGSSGSGKSWLGGLLAEELLRLEYQIFIIDPEGDYRGMKAFPNTLLLGGQQKQPPTCKEISTLLEYSNMSIVLDLSQYEHHGRATYVHELLAALFQLRKNRGRPHWFLIDEIHYFCHEDHALLSKLMSDGMEDGGFALVSYKPSEIASTIRNKIDLLMLTRFDQNNEISALQHFPAYDRSDALSIEKLQAMSNRQVCLMSKKVNLSEGKNVNLIEFEQIRRKVPHIRHLHKYLRAPLPESKRFYFDKHQMRGKGLMAASIYEFLNAISLATDEALEFHLQRGDFELWLQEVLHDEELVKRVRKIRKRKLRGDRLKKALEEAVASRYRELEKLI